MPFEEAREFVRTQCIGSRKQYADWYTANRPKKIPKYPNRAYEDVWRGWNDFLGTNNKFDNTKREYRPFVEALVWANRLGLNKQVEWLDYIRENKEVVPKDIPSRPDLIYDDWLSWNHWLGNKATQKVEAAQKVEKESAVFYCIQEKEYADQRTVFTFGIERGGVSALRDAWNMTKNFRVIKLFQYDERIMGDVQRVIDTHSTRYYGAEKIRICPNINQLCWDISDYLMPVRV